MPAKYRLIGDDIIQVKMLLALNLLDLFMTLYGLNAGYIEEANPLMAGLYEVSPSLFVCVKLAAMLAALAAVWYGIGYCPSRKLLHMLVNTAIAVYCYVVFLNICCLVMVSTQTAQ